jgi:DNA-directed RNA polymerase subunit M/transcription elongation factor TFIIS
MTSFHTWLFLQDGNTCGVNLSSLGSNLQNPVEKIITYKSFLKLIPNSAQDINSKSKLKLVSEWNISGEYYQLYGWISGQSSKINMHNFELDEFPDQDFFGDLILFKVDLSNHHCLEITEIDVHAIDIANREEDIADEEEDNEEEEKEVSESEDENETEKEKDDDEEDDEDEDDSENEEDYNYEDDEEKVEEVEDEDAELYQDDDDEDGEPSSRARKKQAVKTAACNFSRLISNNILKEQLEKTKPSSENEKQLLILENFKKLLFPKKDKLNKNELNIIYEIERGIYNWSIREADKKGFVSTWEDRHFIKIYTRKAISIYQNLLSDNPQLVKFTMDGDNGYKLSEMTPTELNPGKYVEIINKIKEKDKLMFEKRATVGSKHFKCGKCKEKDVAVTTAQTRSGDEGITLFLTCNNCGNQWKMS